MRILALVLALTLGTSLFAADDEPEKGRKEVVISLSETPKEVASKLKAGTSIDVTAEEAGAVPAKTVFLHIRIAAITEDSRKKGGHTITVRMTPAQAKAYEALKDTAKFSVELHKDGSKGR